MCASLFNSINIDLEDDELNMIGTEVACRIDIPKSAITDTSSSCIKCRLGHVSELPYLQLDDNEERTSNILKLTIDHRRISVLGNEVVVDTICSFNYMYPV